MGGKYDDEDWGDLPEDVRKAAEVLGYDEDSWEDDETPEEIDDKDWGDLTPEQQAAATTLGYDEDAWNSSD